MQVCCLAFRIAEDSDSVSSVVWETWTLFNVLLSPPVIFTACQISIIKPKGKNETTSWLYDWNDQRVR